MEQLRALLRKLLGTVSGDLPRSTQDVPVH